SRMVLKLSQQRRFDVMTGPFSALELNERVALSAHYLTKMDLALLAEILNLTTEEVLEALDRGEHRLLSEETLFDDLSLLASECVQVTHTIAFTRGVLTPQKKDPQEHIKNCAICTKLEHHIYQRTDQIIKFLPSIELTELSLQSIVHKGIA